MLYNLGAKIFSLWENTHSMVQTPEEQNIYKNQKAPHLGLTGANVIYEFRETSTLINLQALERLFWHSI